MGEILHIRNVKNGKVLVEVEMDYEEIKKLHGFLDNVHLFSEDSPDIVTRLSQRGSSEATKYFLIPKELRGNLELGENVKCQKIELEENTFFIYMIEKEICE
jgi:hypothetical protein